MKIQNPFHPHILLEIPRVRRSHCHVLARPLNRRFDALHRHLAANALKSGYSRDFACKSGVERRKTRSTPIFY